MFIVSKEDLLKAEAKERRARARKKRGRLRHGASNMLPQIRRIGCIYFDAAGSGEPISTIEACACKLRSRLF
jgi:hypothetical protein